MRKSHLVAVLVAFLHLSLGGFAWADADQGWKAMGSDLWSDTKEWADRAWSGTRDLLSDDQEYSFATI